MSRPTISSNLAHIGIRLLATLSCAVIALLTLPASASRAAPLPQAAQGACLNNATQVSVGATPFTADLGDLNGDGKLDFVVGNRDSTKVGVFLGDGTGNFTAGPSFTPNGQPYGVVLGQLVGDPILDLVVTNFSANSVTVYRGLGDGTFTTHATYPTGSGPFAAAIGDLTSDGRNDLVVTNFYGSTVTIILNSSADGLTVSGTPVVGTYPRGVAIANVNGTSAPEIVVANNGSNTLTILSNNGSNSFSASATITTASAPNSVMVADIDGDGWRDLLVPHGTSNVIGVWLNTAGTGFGSMTSYPVGSNPINVAVGDINGDGVVDLAVPNWYSYNVGVLYGTGGGIFRQQRTISTGAQVNNARIGDLDNDGRLDVIAANFGSASVSVIRNNLLDSTAPVGSLTINGGSAWTNNPSVTLYTSATDATCGTEAVAVSPDGISYGAFTPVTANQSWTLTAGDGPKQVYARYRDWAGNISTAVQAGVTLDTVAPTASFTINAGATTTVSRTVTLGVTTADATAGVSDIQLAEGPTTSGWIAANTSVPWTLSSGDGSKTITLRARDRAGNQSNVITRTIMLDTQAPTATLAPLDAYQSPTNIRITAQSTAPDIASYDLQVRVGSSATWSDWQSGATVTSWVYPGVEGTAYAFRIRARDQAGNLGAYSPEVRTMIDTIAPTAERITINEGAAATTSQNVLVRVAAQDSASGVASMRLSADGISWRMWQPYATRIEWTLDGGEGAQRVYVQFADAAGNTSAVINAAVTLDTALGTLYGVSINTGALFTNNVAVALALSAPAYTSAMQVSNDGGFVGAVWEPFTTRRVWTITDYGAAVLPRTVYVRYRDSQGAVSTVVQDDIILDTTPPVGGIELIETLTRSAMQAPGVTLLLTASDDVSGVATMRVSRHRDFNDTSWQPYVTQLRWSGDPKAPVYVQYRDRAGNTSPLYATSATSRIFVPLVVGQ